MRLFGFRCFLMGSIGRGSKFLPKDSSLLEEGVYSKNDGHATSSFCSRWPFMFNSCALNLSHRYQSFSSIIIQEIHQIRTNWIQLAFVISFFGCSLHIMTEQAFFFILGFFFKVFVPEESEISEARTRMLDVPWKERFPSNSKQKCSKVVF